MLKMLYYSFFFQGKIIDWQLIQFKSFIINWQLIRLSVHADCCRHVIINLIQDKKSKKKRLFTPFV